MWRNPESETESGHAWWIALLLFAVFLALRLPFRADFLTNWDSVNFALATRLFDLEVHQPHPPGYIGYVAFGWLLNPLTGDANASLTLLSALSGAAATAGFFLLASLFMSRLYAVASAVLLGVSPLVWYYSSVALSYSVELALAVFFLWAGFLARHRGSVAHLLLATVLLVVLGAVRQTGGLLLTPLWLYLVWTFPWRERFRAAAVLGAGNLAWLIPLFWVSGGVGAYFRISAEQADLSVAPTSLLAMDPGGIWQNVSLVVLALGLGVNFGLLVILGSLLLGRRAFRVPGQHAAFFGLWVVPALLTFLLVHTGQAGYVLLVLPLFFILVGTGLQALVEAHTSEVGSRARGAQTAPRVGGRAPAFRYGAGGLAAVLVLGSGSLFFSAPPAIAGWASEARAHQGAVSGFLQSLPAIRMMGIRGGYMIDGWRQYDLRANDRYWEELIGFVREHDPARTAVLTQHGPDGSFRHFTYYLPEYRVHAFGRDARGIFGHLFTAFGGTSDYRVPGLRESSPSVPLAAGVERVVVSDPEVQEAVRRSHEAWAVETVNLANGGDVTVLTVAAEAEAHAFVVEDGGLLHPSLGLSRPATAEKNTAETASR